MAVFLSALRVLEGVHALSDGGIGMRRCRRKNQAPDGGEGGREGPPFLHESEGYEHSARLARVLFGNGPCLPVEQH